MTTLSRTQRRTYDALVRAGLEILLEAGYDALNVSAITRRADYGRSTFYLYFKDKEDFIWQILREQAALMDAYILGEVAGLDYPERERRAWALIFGLVQQQMAFWRKLDGETSQRLRQRQQALLVETFERNLREGRFRLPGDLPPEIGARLLVGASQELLLYWLSNPDLGDAPQLADLFCDFVYR